MFLDFQRNTLLSFVFLLGLAIPASASNVGTVPTALRIPEANKDAKALVVVFLSFDCPVARSYIEPLNELAKAYRDRGVEFVGFVPGEHAADLKRGADEYKPSFPIHADPDHKAADALKARTVPEVFILDRKNVLRYRGRIDDRWLTRGKVSLREPKPEMRNALDEVLAGKAVTVQETESLGCPIVQTKPQSGAAVTFHQDVLPILQNRCQECHRPGEAGPFSLLTYKQTARFAELIKDYVVERKMPPWKPVDGSAFHFDRRMTKAEIETIAAWVDGGAAEGDVKSAPPAKPFPGGGWLLGKPDLVLEVADDFELAANGPDAFRCFVLPTRLTEDCFLSACEVKPGNPRVVHHVLSFFDRTGTARKLEQEERMRTKPTGELDRGPGYPVGMGIGFKPEKPDDIGALGGWAPGFRGIRTPAGTGLFLPRGSDIVLQMHYHRDGKPAKDRTRVGLYFSKEKNLEPLQSLMTRGLFATSRGFEPFSTIPAGESSWRVEGRFVIEQDCTAYSVLPHMHMLGKSAKMSVIPPGGRKRVLISIAEWDYNWQENYYFREPIRLKAGTILVVEGVYDNSAANISNPFSPPRDVNDGEQTLDEMLRGFMSVTADRSGPVTLRPLTEKKDYSGGR